MRLRFKSILSTASICLPFVLLLAAGSGRAESPGGKFTLPFEVHWGVAVLPPGDYSFTVVSSLGTSHYLDVRGKKNSAYIFPAETETGTDTGPSHLTTVTIGGNHFIEQMVLKEANTTFKFRLPKAAKSEAQFTPLMLSHTGQGI
ncbi:MAG: hypothetical protein ACRD18_12195 [Terriglobia bacterium]